MKLIIFAGGIGTRLWPLSRVNSPKQFDKIFAGKSTLQLAVERVAPTFGMKNIFIQTQRKYKKNIINQLPGFLKENIIIEPERRNLGPAVCLSMLELKKRGYGGAVAILWADHLMKRQKDFVSALKKAKKLINQKSDQIIFIGEKSRFANNNLGWIKVGGAKNGFYNFKSWKYKPDPQECKKMLASGKYFWNPGYFITSVDFLLDKYQELSPDIYKKVFEGDYKNAQPIHFDRAIAERIKPSEALVIKTDMGWSDPGTLYALKEALEKNHEANVTRGEVASLDTKDSLIYNFEKNKLVATIGLDGLVVVSMKDVLLVVPKDEVVKITSLIDKIKAEGLFDYL